METVSMQEVLFYEIGWKGTYQPMHSLFLFPMEKATITLFLMLQANGKICIFMVLTIFQNQNLWHGSSKIELSCLLLCSIHCFYWVHLYIYSKYWKIIAFATCYTCLSILFSFHIYGSNSIQFSCIYPLTQNSKACLIM